MRIVAAAIVVVALFGAAMPAATAQTRPRPTPLPKTCTNEIATPGAPSCKTWLTGQAPFDIQDAIGKAVASFAVDKGAGFILGQIGFASLVDPNSGRFDALSAQLDQIAQQITVLQTSTDNVFTALKQLSLDTKLQYLRDLVINIKTLFSDYYLPIVDAVPPLLTALRADPTCAEAACKTARADIDRLKKSFLDQFEGGGGVNLAATNTKIHQSLLPSDPGQSVLSAYGDVLMSQNRFLSEVQSGALRQLYTTFAGWQALATWMKAEWTAATRPARLPTLIDEEITGYAKTETDALPPKIPAGAVIDLGPTAATRISTRNRPMWQAAASNLVWRTSGAPAPNDVASAIVTLNKNPNGLDDWKPPTRAQMDVLLATAKTPAPPVATLRAISPGSATWTQVVNGSPNVWTSDNFQTVNVVTCSFYFFKPAAHASKTKRFTTAGPYTTHTAYTLNSATNSPVNVPLPRIWPLTVPNPQEIASPASAQRAPCDSYVSAFFNRATGTLLATRQTADSAKEDYMAVSTRPAKSQPKATTLDGLSESTTTVSSSQNPAPFGEAVTFSARVQGADGGQATGTVQFAVDGVVVGDPVPVQGGTATSAPLANLATGTRRVEALYDGGSELASSSGILKPDQDVDRVATALALAADPPNPSYEGDPVVFRVTASAQGPGAGGGAPTGTVSLREGGTLVGTAPLDGGGQAVITVPNLTDGTHQLVASYPGDDNFEDAKSAPVQQRVVNLQRITVTPAQVAALGQGDTVQLTATGTFNDNTTADLTADVKWSSSNPGVATVSRTGLVTIASDAPKTTVTIVATLAQQRDTSSIAVGLPRPSPPPTTSDTKPKTPASQPVNPRYSGRR